MKIWGDGGWLCALVWRGVTGGRGQRRVRGVIRAFPAEQVHTKLGPMRSTAFFFFSLSFRFEPVGGAAVFPS